MEGQMTLAQSMSSVTYDRYGRPYQTPEWMDKPRCELCEHWARLPVEDQPPDGWGVMGLCNTIHDPSQVGYFNTDKTSRCDMYEGEYE